MYAEREQKKLGNEDTDRQRGVRDQPGTNESQVVNDGAGSEFTDFDGAMNETSINAQDAKYETRSFEEVIEETSKYG